MLNTEKTLFEIETKSSKELGKSKESLQALLLKLENLIREIESYIDSDRKLSKELFQKLKELVNEITSSQEQYASYFGKNESMKSDSIKRKERIKVKKIEKRK